MVGLQNPSLAWEINDCLRCRTDTIEDAVSGLSMSGDAGKWSRISHARPYAGGFGQTLYGQEISQAGTHRLVLAFVGLSPLLSQQLPTLAGFRSGCRGTALPGLKRKFWAKLGRVFIVILRPLRSVGKRTDRGQTARSRLSNVSASQKILCFLGVSTRPTCA